MATRTFLALDLEAKVRQRLGRVQAQLAEVGADVRWVDPEQIHVTLQFLGDVTDDDLSEVCRLAAEAASGVEAFEFEVGEVIATPPHGRMRMVWADIGDPTGRMGALHDRLNDLAAGMGYKTENRRFRPHLTLGRVKGSQEVPQLRQRIGQMSGTTFGRQWGDELVVYASRLSPAGPAYIPLATAPLG